MVIWFLAGSRVDLPSLSVASTSILPSAGRYFDTGSASWILPSSTSIIAPTEVSGFVIEKISKIASFVIGLLAALSWKPTASA